MCIILHILRTAAWIQDIIKRACLILSCWASVAYAVMYGTNGQLHESKLAPSSLIPFLGLGPTCPICKWALDSRACCLNSLKDWQQPRKQICEDLIVEVWFIYRLIVSQTKMSPAYILVAAMVRLSRSTLCISSCIAWLSLIFLSPGTKALNCWPWFPCSSCTRSDVHSVLADFVPCVCASARTLLNDMLSPVSAKIPTITKWFSHWLTVLANVKVENSYGGNQSLHSTEIHGCACSRDFR